MNLGDRVTLHATIRKLIGDRASISIPGYNFPHSMPAPPKAKRGETINIYGEVERIDGSDITILLDLSGRITIKEEAIAKVEPAKV